MRDEGVNFERPAPPSHDCSDCRRCAVRLEFRNEALRAYREWVAGGRKGQLWSEVKKELGIG